MIIYPEHDKEARKVVEAQVKDLDFALDLVGNFAACVQAGGNVGVWPKYLAKRFQTVYTFEPDHENFHCLVYNAPEPNIIKVQGFLGDDRRLVGIDRVEGNCGAHQLDGLGNIPMFRIDDLNLPNCGLIQLDIEGMEYWALNGALETLKRCKPVIMVEDKGLSERYDVKQGEIRWLMKTVGYEFVKRRHRDDIFKCAA